MSVDSGLVASPTMDLSLVEFDADALDVDRIAAAYSKFGFFVVRGLMRQYVEAFQAEVLGAVELARRELPDAELMRYGWLTASGAIFTDRAPEGFPSRRQLIVAPITAENSKIFADVANDARTLALVRHLLRGDAHRMGNGQCMYKEALHGNPAALHQDAVYPGGENYRDVVIAFTYLVPSPVERGCIWAIPESHRDGLLPHEEGGVHDGSIPTDICDFDQAVALPGEAGDVVFWDYYLVHGSKQNLTSQPRPAAVSRYGRLRREES